MDFSQNEEDLQCPKKNYFKEVMQNFERKGKGKKKVKKIDLYAYKFYMESCG